MLIALAHCLFCFLFFMFDVTGGQVTWPRQEVRRDPARLGPQLHDQGVCVCVCAVWLLPRWFFMKSCVDLCRQFLNDGWMEEHNFLEKETPLPQDWCVIV
jgi:hypothetical protein